MAIHSVQTLEDPALAPYRDLKASNATRWSNTFVAEGDKLVRRLLESDLEVVSLLVGERCLPVFEPLAAERAPLLVVPDAWIESLVGFNFHRGALACGRRRTHADVRALDKWENKLTLVVCPDVQDPENLGAILRNSAALGVDGVVLGPGCCDLFSRRVLRVSMGAAFRMPIVECGKSVEFEAALVALRREMGAQIWGTVIEQDATPFDRLPRPARVALLFGSEGHGLEDRWLGHCDQRITIPMRPGTDSLNVAVAAGLLLYYFGRRDGDG